ncbi:MAG: 2,3-bisphosphoglycerate-independent phosphoglycerate mutase [Desulfamplus sp.]|nr:2,3-bisphosphoglycerate-independent phosphoglycerate mutase [Desulfamplus sp.]
MTQEIGKNRVDALLILDGWGVNPVATDNAVAMAHMPFLDMLEKNYPCTTLLCSGNAVGLPDGVMGNSEVGHMNIGAGRKVYQDLVRINLAIKDKSFFANPSLVELMNTVKNKNIGGKECSLHLMGLLSDGGVHSDINHLFALIDMACEAQIKHLFIHAIMDGRDTPPQSGIQYLTRLTQYLDKKGTGSIATICGRFYAMDRDTRWDRVEKAYELYTQGIGEHKTQGVGDHKTDAIQAINDAYKSGQTDEFVKPVLLSGKDGRVQNKDDIVQDKDGTVQDKDGTVQNKDDIVQDKDGTVQDKDGTIQDGDAVIFFNFRADRAREIIRAFTEKSFAGFERKNVPEISGFLCMTQYDESFSLPVIFKPQHLYNILGEIVSHHGFAQLRIAETEKYAHVTYFFNGGDEKVFPLEERILIPSPREVRTYDEKPEMSAYAVAQAACNRIHEGNLRLVVLNFANMDMVGHTGKLDAAIKACSTVDICVKQVVEAVWKTGGTAMITADHGNAEQMKDKDGNPHTAHTLNPVKFIIAGEKYRNTKLNTGILGDIAPTILKVMEIEQPEDMSGKSLFQ